MIRTKSETTPTTSRMMPAATVLEPAAAFSRCGRAFRVIGAVRKAYKHFGRSSYLKDKASSQQTKTFFRWPSACELERSMFQARVLTERN